MKSHSFSQNVPAFCLAGIFLILLWAWALGWALAGYPLFRDQHLGTAIVYARNGIDLLRPVIVGFNINDAGTPQELPLWQAVAGIALKAAGGWWGAANLVSLVLFTLFLPWFYYAAKWEAGITAAWLALALLIAQPIVFHIAGMAATDGFSLALLLAFLGSSEWLRRRQSFPSLFACVAASTLLGITKLPFLMVGGIAAILMLLWERHTLRCWVFLALAGAFALCVFYVWNRWCEAEIGRAEFRYRPVMLKEMPQWFFGTLAMRLDPAVYIKSGWRALSCLWGSFIAVGLTLYGLWKRPKSLGSALLIAGFVVMMIFFNLVTKHRHYYLMFAPAVALLNAYALCDLMSHLSAAKYLPRFLGNISLGICLLLSLLQGLITIEAFNTDPFPRRVATLLATHTSPAEKIVVINAGWGGDLLLRADRRGLSADTTKLIEDASTRNRLRELGFTKIAIFSESPLLHALQITNPGSAELKRVVWRDFLSDANIGWPRIFESEDMAIIAIPE